MLIFRIVVLATVGGTVFKDEQEEFVCNTTQPGCRQTCYNRAFPVSHVLPLSAPSVLSFTYYSPQHRKQTDLEEKDRKEQDDRKRGKAPEGRASGCYVLSVALRPLREPDFRRGRTPLYGFRVAPRLECRAPPCPRAADCCVGRPTEKTVFVLFYFAIGTRSVLFGVLEPGSLLWKGRAGYRQHDLPGDDGTPELLPPPSPQPCAPLRQRVPEHPVWIPCGQRAPVSNSQGKDRLDLSREPLSV